MVDGTYAALTTAQSQSAYDRVGSHYAGKYKVLRLLGSGGMGHVYEAENTALGKRVAVKFLHMTAQKDETSLARFHREARAMCAVESMHIVQVFDWGRDDDGQPFLVMELLEGRELGERIKQLGRMPVEEAVRFAVEALRGLRRVHAAGIVHRDLKPENLFLITGDDDRLHVKIVDFGLSKLIDTEHDPGDLNQSLRLTQQGAILGTPLYMCPEQVEALLEIDHRADIWAIGVILYEMLSGSPPFMDRSYARLVMSICQRDAADLTKINPRVPPELDAIVRHAMQRDRERRFQSAGEFLRALGSVTPLLGLSRLSDDGAISKTKLLPTDDDPVPAAALSPGKGAASPSPVAVASVAVGASPPSSKEGGPLDATIAAHTRNAATVWLTDAPMFSLWRGEVDSPDRLRIEARDGSVRDLRLEPVGTLTLGRVKQVGADVNDLVYPDVASRLAARLIHDGIRWWLERRDKCSVPVVVGTRQLAREERAPLVHGTFVSVGAMRATMVDRRYVSRQVPSGTVDSLSGLLARSGLEQEVATALQQQGSVGLVLVQMYPDKEAQQIPTAVQGALAVHRMWPSYVIARDRETVALLVRADEEGVQQHAEEAAKLCETLVGAEVRVVGVGYWMLRGEPASAGSEVELALNAIDATAACGNRLGTVLALHELHQASRMSGVSEVLERARDPKRQMLLFGIEEQSALGRVGPQVIGALEQELAAMITTQVGPAAMVTRLAAGIIGVCFPRKLSAPTLGVQIQCEWHARPPITDGKLELPRTISWEEVLAERAEARATELSRECGDAHGVLSALSGGLPYPIAGRVHAAIGASSAVERVKMLFDVLEGTWRFIAVVLAAAYFSKGGDADHSAIRAFYDRMKTRAGFPLGAWRELARLAAKGFVGQEDPIGQLAGQLLEVKVTPNQTFDALSNLMHSERNSFAHGHYNEARAAADVTEFEQMTRTFLRALRPLAAWTLVTVQRTEPDLYGESQTVEFVDHTGPYATGARRRFGFASSMRLANVVYLARWRDGLVLPLEPFVRRIAHDDRFDLFWMDHLPRTGPCNMSSVVSGDPLRSSCDLRRLPPVLRSMVS